ncbi:MAG TPA: SUMF1/EgtB/PvdO family nonheme iron enzyme [Aggregatilineaceae bacterium]|nr:SUMF1/EgtB/PvdO family nonheme iron enzyme [Aggregatilineaceae bacterium]
MLVGLLLAGIIYGLTRSDTPPVQKHTLAASSTATILPTRTVETTVTAEAAPTQTPAAITAIPTDEPSALQNGFATLAFAPGMVAIRDTGIATFAINQIPVTHEAFQLYLQSHRGSITNDALQRLMDETEEGRPDAPMMNLTWAEARAYCQSQQKDLPRVEQWEAARLWLVSDIEEWVFTSGAPYLSLEPDGSVVEHDYDRPDSSIGFRCVTPLIN